MTDYAELEAKGDFKKLLELTSSDTSIEGVYWRMTALHRLGMMNKLLPMISKINLENMDDYWKIRFLNRYGTIWRPTEELEVSKNYFERALELAIKNDDYLSQAQILTNLFVLHFNHQNPSPTIVEYLNRALTLLNEHPDDKILGYALAQKASLLSFLGEYEEAMEIVQQTIDLRYRLGNQYDIGYSLLLLAGIQDVFGMSKKSLVNTRKSVSILRNTGNVGTLSGPLVYLIIRLLEHGEVAEATERFDEFKTVMSISFDKEDIKFIFSFFDALFLKASNRPRDKMKALQIFEDLVVEDTRLVRNFTNLRKHLIELLLIEYKSSPQEEIFREIVHHIDLMAKDAEQARRPTRMIEVKILRAQISLLQNDFDQADQLLDEGLQIAQDRGMVSYSKLVEQEKQKLRDNITMIKEQMESSNIVTNIEKMKIWEYLKKVQSSFGD